MSIAMTFQQNPTSHKVCAKTVHKLVFDVSTYTTAGFRLNFEYTHNVPCQRALTGGGGGGGEWGVPHLPSRRSLRGPYLSMTMPRGKVMALSKKEPTVKAKFNISSWSLHTTQPRSLMVSSLAVTCVSFSRSWPSED